jgi:hypothetical protein
MNFSIRTPNNQKQNLFSEMNEEMRSRAKAVRSGFEKGGEARLGELREKDAANLPAFGTGELEIAGGKTERRGAKVREIRWL